MPAMLIPCVYEWNEMMTQLNPQLFPSKRRDTAGRS